MLRRRHIVVERLDNTEVAELLGVLGEAFAKHPMLPEGTPREKTEALMRLIVDSFGGSDDAGLHGIRRDGELACVAFTMDAQQEPKGLAKLFFVAGLFRILGWRLAVGFFRALGRRPRREGRYLELTLLGTLPAHHGEGLGRAMMHFLYEHAEEQGYRGVVLEVARDTPARGFYEREGFVLDREIPVGATMLCCMRREGDAVDA
jgi:ribosomal protein S18 acetylase RimI-like enzyme